MSARFGPSWVAAPPSQAGANPVIGKEYCVISTRSTGGGAPTYVYGDMTTGTVPGRNKLGNTTVAAIPDVDTALAACPMPSERLTRV
jgi:hypothetical protein